MLVDLFVDYSIAIKGRSMRTCQEYRKEVLFFADWLEPSMNVDDVLCLATTEDVEKYLVWCDQVKKNAGSTRARKISALRSFYNFCVRKKIVLTNPLTDMERPKYTRSLPVFLNLDDYKRLIQSARSREDLFYRRRNTLILILFINCGLRLSELASIQMSDIYDDAILIRGKGDKERFAYLNKSCQRALRLWLGKRGSSPGYLIITKQGKGLQASSVASVVKAELHEVGLDNISTHKLRHTAATLLYRQGHVDIRLLQRILGHASIATTEIYTHVVDEQIIQAMEAHPLSDF